MTGGRARKEGGGRYRQVCLFAVAFKRPLYARFHRSLPRTPPRFSAPATWYLPRRCPATCRPPRCGAAKAPRGLCRNREGARAAAGALESPRSVEALRSPLQRQEAERRRRTRRARGGTRRSTAGGRAARRRGAETCRRPASSRARRRRTATSARTAGRRPVAAAERSGERTERVRLVHVSRSSDQKLHDLQMVCRLFFAAAWKSGVFHRPSRAASLSTSAPVTSRWPRHPAAIQSGVQHGTASTRLTCPCPRRPRRG